MMIQIIPPMYWAESMHVSGLFWDMIKTVMEDKVRISVVLLRNVAYNDID
jgi:hypothetical protein